MEDIQNTQNQYKKMLEFVKKRRQGAVEFCDFISKRVKAEVQYSKSLYYLANTPLILSTEFLYSHPIDH
jgi:hypothetical protein